MKNKRIFFLLMMLGGAILLFAAIFVFNTTETRMVSGLCFGLSATTISLGAGWFIRSFLVSPEEDDSIRKQKEIEVKDERNTRIRERTGYMVARVMNYVLCAFILVLGFMGVDRTIILLVAGMIALEFILTVYFSNRYSKIL